MEESLPRQQPTRSRRSAAAKSERAVAESAPPAKAAAPVARPTPKIDLDSPELYLNRELTWLKFNRRVLHEAEDERTPLLERVKFLAILSSNLDEFFMKRIGGLKQQVAAGVHEPTVDGRTAVQQLIECHAEINDIQARREAAFDQVFRELEQHGVKLLRYADLNDDQRARLREHYINNIFPAVTPLGMDPAHPFPFISNLALNLLVTVRFPGDTELRMARVKLPINKEVTGRLLRLRDGYAFVSLEDVMTNNLDLLFPGMEIESCELFRVTRNANTELDEEEAQDLLEMIETELRDRHFSPIVRLQVGKGMNPVHRGMLAAELGLDEAADVFEVSGMIAMRDLMEIANLDIPELRTAPHHPLEHRRLAHDARNIFYIVRDGGPMLLQHPYESFSTSVERFLSTAADDPKVLAIKMTLYRTSADGKVINALINAAKNGKQVAVLVELKARFDEAANIGWARHLEQHGIHVTYGVVGLKTHSKVILVVRKDYDGLRRYAHIGTGNYHAGTARLYCDVGLITADEKICQDLTEQFNYLTGYSPPPRYRKILAAPYTLKKSLLEKIEREAALHTPDAPGLIQLKMNALEDSDITKALYKAGQAGVKVDLIVRDTCRFRPGMPGLSESARVISIVGRFLEHCRIYYFQNGGDEEYYIGSADLMRRNLESRVEVVTPVEDPESRQDLRLILDLQLADQRTAWDMQSDGSYVQRQPPPDKPAQGSQETLIEVAKKNLAAATKNKQQKMRNKLFKQIRSSLNAPS